MLLPQDRPKDRIEFDFSKEEESPKQKMILALLSQIDWGKTQA
jgi:hypothetical protein